MSDRTEAREKLQKLLRDLFQFDCSDLDFGIYRIMNQKRAEIERFIEHGLLNAVSTELGEASRAARSQAEQERDRIADQIRAVDPNAIAGDGSLREDLQEGELGQRYLELREQAADYGSRPEQETLIFNHLFSFFRRYYQDGDFISKRRYSKRERYAIPYNGEEVYLYWANKDQYYVKTGEHFRDYRFNAPGDVAVHFKLPAADVEQNNVKGEKRFFIPLAAEAAWNEAAREVVIPCEYRPLTEQEGVTYGTRDQQRKIIKDALEQIPARLKKHPEAVGALMAERRRNADRDPVSYLEHHLNQYTARNTRDFFIHKNLRSFLERELDFYLKNEVLNLDEILAGGDQHSDDGPAGYSLGEGWFQLMQVMRRIALHIITFLAQIEDFQKKLWEKKKFVLSTEYCMTLDRVPERFYTRIARNKEQVNEWRRLLRIDEIAPDLFQKGGKKRPTKAFLKAHPSLVVDTRFFDDGFKDELLASVEDLDEKIGGLLVQGENLGRPRFCGHLDSVDGRTTQKGRGERCGSAGSSRTSSSWKR